MPNTPDLKTLLSYISSDAKQLSMVIQFDLANLDQDGRFPLVAKDWSLAEFKSITAWSQRLALPENKAWPCVHVENHDLARCVSRFGNDSREFRVMSAKLMGTYQLTLSGSPIIYQGQEIGMINCPKSWPMSKYTDVNSVNSLKEIADLDDPALVARGEDGVRRIARDHARTPMQWDDSPQAGFSTNEKTWMRVMDSYVEINVREQEGRKGSVLEFYKSMLKLRKEYANVMVEGEFVLLDEENGKTMSYLKKGTGKTIFVALNFGEAEQDVYSGKEVGGKMKLLFSTTGNAEKDLGKQLEAYEARVYLLE